MSNKKFSVAQTAITVHTPFFFTTEGAITEARGGASLPPACRSLVVSENGSASQSTFHLTSALSPSRFIPTSTHFLNLQALHTVRVLLATWHTP